MTTGGNCAIRVAIVLLVLAYPASASSFANTASLANEQWYLSQDKAWSFWATTPVLAPVRVAVIDTGIDFGHPEFKGQIVGGKSFVGGTWKRDTDGHGTFVAGEIAAKPRDGEGIAGLAFNARLLIAKVVEADGTIPILAEARAIRWAANNGARVINLSIGGVRDPLDLKLDTYSQAEERAVEYAYAKGAVVVAAVGNGTEAPHTPWPFADYPAALPNVLGVSALNRDGSVPSWSNRDPTDVDLSAPGSDILSTIPRPLENSSKLGCSGIPYSNCGPTEYENAEGTSFAAPQVSAAAALLIGEDPALSPDQVVWLLERSATDMNPSDGCPNCRRGRDALSGWGRLNVDSALRYLTSRKPLPPPDLDEPDVDAGTLAHALEPRRSTIATSLDYWDDPVDVFSVRLQRHAHLYARATPDHGTTRLTLWAPGTATVYEPYAARGDRLADSIQHGSQARLAYLAPAAGVYYLEVTDASPLTARLDYHLAIVSRVASAAPAREK